MYKMKKLFLVGALAAGVSLAALFLFFNYLKPAQMEEKTVPPAGESVGEEEVPVGYFDLRGIKETLVDMRDFDFNPRRIVISPGTKVIWKNRDDVFHSVIWDSYPVGSAQLVNSKPLKTNEMFTQVLSTPGTYTYHSADNPATMTGLIVVKPR